MRTADIKDSITEHGKKLLSVAWRRRIAQQRLAIRLVTARFRMLPDVLIIGGQRCGTSSLYKYLAQHPQLEASIRKETQYFSAYLQNGEQWYRAHFPLARPDAAKNKSVCFEATPDYLLDLRCAVRAAATVPEARIVALLRDPVDRAISHYQHNRRLGLEPLSFQEALEFEDARLSDHLALVQQKPDIPFPKPLCRFSYVTRGLYCDQLSRWMQLFPPDRIFVASSEDFFRNPSEVLLQLFAFLKVSPRLPSKFNNYSYVGGGRPVAGGDVSQSTRDKLKRRFREPNEALYDLLGRRFGW